MRALLPVSVAALFIVAACTNLQGKVEKQVDKSDAQASDLVNKVGRTAPGVVTQATPFVEHEDGIWLSKKAVKLGQPALPSIFYEPATFERTVNSLSEFAERITLRSGIVTKVSPDAMAEANIVQNGGRSTGATGQTSSTPAAQPAASPAIGGGNNAANAAQQVKPVHISYSSGNFKGLLDTATARFGIYWKYIDGTIQFFHTDSRTFQITAIPGDTALSATVTSGASSTGGVSSGGGSGGGGGGSSGGGGGSSNGVSSNNSQNMGVTSQLSVFTNIEKSVHAMLSTHGRAVASPSTGSITVMDTPDTLERIASFIEMENKTLSKQVVVNVTVLSVTLNNEDQYGIDWTLVYQGLSNVYKITNQVAASTNATALSAGILSSSTSKFAGSQLMINALSQQGKVREKTTASVVTLNNQPVPVQVATQTSYLQSTQTTVTSLVGATTTMTPGQVTTGFNMSLLPHILDNGTIMLQFSTDISSLVSLTTFNSASGASSGSSSSSSQAASNSSTIQLPVVATQNFLQRVAMKSNETLVVSGFEQINDSLTRNGVGHPENPLLGGGFDAQSNKEIIVVLITPTTTQAF